MTALLLVMLAIAWVAVFVPAAWRARRESPVVATRTFKREMDLIGSRPAPGSALSSVASDEARRRIARRRIRRRRRRTFSTLAIGAVSSLPCAVLWGGVLWQVHTAAVCLLVAYVSLLLAHRQRRARRPKVTRLQRDVAVGGRDAVAVGEGP